MSLNRKLQTKLARFVVDPRVLESKRRWFEARRKPAVVSAFLQIDDPYSYILSRYLPALASHFDIELRLYLSVALGDEYRPEPASRIAA